MSILIKPEEPISMDIAALSTELATARILQQVQVKMAKGASESVEAVAAILLEGISQNTPSDVGSKLNIHA